MEKKNTRFPEVAYGDFFDCEKVKVAKEKLEKVLDFYENTEISIPNDLVILEDRIEKSLCVAFFGHYDTPGYFKKYLKILTKDISADLINLKFNIFNKGLNSLIKGKGLNGERLRKYAILVISPYYNQIQKENVEKFNSPYRTSEDSLNLRALSFVHEFIKQSFETH